MEKLTQSDFVVSYKIHSCSKNRYFKIIENNGIFFPQFNSNQYPKQQKVEVWNDIGSCSSLQEAIDVINKISPVDERNL